MLPHVAVWCDPYAPADCSFVRDAGARFLDPTAFIAMPLLFLPLKNRWPRRAIRLGSDGAVAAGLAPFWLPYMNFWMAGRQHHPEARLYRLQLFNIANIYAVSAILALINSILY